MMEGVSISFPERESDPDTIEVASEKELVAAFVELVEKIHNGKSLSTAILPM